MASPRTWNLLPASLRLVDDYVHFKCLLKASFVCLFVAVMLSDF